MEINTVIVALDSLAFIAAIAMTYSAFKAYGSLKSKQSLAFLACFSLITIGLFFQGYVDAVVDITQAQLGFISGLTGITLTQKLFLLIASLCILTGYTLLLFAVERIRKRSMWLLTFVLLAFTILLANDIFLITHVLAIILLALLAFRFWKNFIKKNHTNALLVYFAFLALTAAHVAALLIPFGRIPHLIFLALRLLGYFLLFAVMYRVNMK